MSNISFKKTSKSDTKSRRITVDAPPSWRDADDTEKPGEHAEIPSDSSVESRKKMLQLKLMGSSTKIEGGFSYFSAELPTVNENNPSDDQVHKESRQEAELPKASTSYCMDDARNSVNVLTSAPIYPPNLYTEHDKSDESNLDLLINTENTVSYSSDEEYVFFKGGHSETEEEEYYY